MTNFEPSRKAIKKAIWDRFCESPGFVALAKINDGPLIVTHLIDAFVETLLEDERNFQE